MAPARLAVRLVAQALAQLAALAIVAAQCSGSTYSYGSGACASCAAGASFISSSAGCKPSTTLTAGPADTALYLSGSQAEGVAAFAATGAAPSYAADAFGNAGGALVLAGGSYLTAPGSSAPAALPSGGNVAWSASAWVRCVAPISYAAVLEWGAVGDAQMLASSQALALVVGGANRGVVTSLAGSGIAAFVDGTGAGASFNFPAGVAVIPLSGLVVAADRNNNLIRLVDPTSGVVTTLAGSGSESFADGTGPAASFNNPRGIAVIPWSGVIIVADTDNNRIRLVTLFGVVTTLAGSGSAAFADGTGAAASFRYPRGVAVIPLSGLIVVADTNNNRIRIVDPTSRAVTTLAGSGSPAFADGMGATASFNGPYGVAIIPLSGIIVVADQGNSRIRLVNPTTGDVTTLAGSGNSAFSDGLGAAASFFNPYGVATVPSSGLIVVGDYSNSRIRLVNPTSGAVTTIAGSSNQAFADGTGAAASFYLPWGVAVIPSSSVIVVADAGNNRIRLVALPPVLPACDSTWHHVALTYSPSSAPYQLSAFLDGALVVASSVIISLPAATSSSLRIGWSGSLTTNGGSLFAGLVGDVRVFSRSLSNAEVVQLLPACIAGRTWSRAGKWPCAACSTCGGSGEAGVASACTLVLDAGCSCALGFAASPSGCRASSSAGSSSDSSSSDYFSLFLLFLCGLGFVAFLRARATQRVGPVEATPSDPGVGGGDATPLGLTDLFISYAWGPLDEATNKHPLQERVLAIVKQLCDAGFTVWLDREQMPRSATGGASGTPEAMVQGILHASAVICFFSTEYAHSPNCKIEAQFAKKKDKPMFFINVGAPGYKADKYSENESAAESWLDVLMMNTLWFDARDEQRTASQIADLISALKGNANVSHSAR